MDYLEFLEDDDKGKAQLLTTLQLYNEQFLSKKKLIELTGLSKFLLEKYISDLNSESCELRISEQNYDEIVYRPISNETIQKLHHLYVKRSLKFIFFVEVLVEEKSIKKFQEEQHIAKTTLYQIRQKVLSCLKKTGLSIKKNKLASHETHVRSTIFDIVSYFYFGEKHPFSKQNEKESQAISTNVINYFNLDLTFLERKKLFLFIQIVQIRVKNHHHLKENFCTIDDNTQQTFASQLLALEKMLHPSSLPQTDHFEETNYLLSFLFISDMFDCDLHFNKELSWEAHETTQQLVNVLTTTFVLTQQQETNLYHSFFKKILGLSIFRQNYTTFIDVSAYSYFSEVYYPLHRIILRFVRKNNALTSLELSKDDRAKLYYDLMFSTLALLTPDQLGTPINIYIDFSHGAAYTEYIRQSLQRFRDLNIIIQKKFNNDTRISISDYKIQELTCQQIIWKQPPTPSDWGKFADLVIELREVENEKDNLF